MKFRWIEGHFTLNTESPWSLLFKHSHWWRKRSRSKFASHYTWVTNGVCEWKVDVRSTWIPTWHQMGHVSWSLGLFTKTTSWRLGLTQPGDHGTPNAYNHCFNLFYHVWGPAWIEIHWKSIWLRPGHIWLHTTLEDMWPHYMVLGVTWDNLWTLFFWALTISWSWLMGSHNLIMPFSYEFWYQFLLF